MTLEAENELVARWMGWEWIGGNIQLWHHDVPHDGLYRDSPPPYRSDLAMNRELEVRLCERYMWRFTYCYDGCWRSKSADNEGVYETLAEAVFAAAVIEAQREGK